MSHKERNKRHGPARSRPLSSSYDSWRRHSPPALCADLRRRPLAGTAGGARETVTLRLSSAPASEAQWLTASPPPLLPLLTCASLRRGGAVFGRVDRCDRRSWQPQRSSQRNTSDGLDGRRRDAGGGAVGAVGCASPCRVAAWKRPRLRKRASRCRRGDQQSCKSQGCQKAAPESRQAAQGSVDHPLRYLAGLKSRASAVNSVNCGENGERRRVPPDGPHRKSVRQRRNVPCNHASHPSANCSCSHCSNISSLLNAIRSLDLLDSLACVLSEHTAPTGRRRRRAFCSLTRTPPAHALLLHHPALSLALALPKL